MRTNLRMLAFASFVLASGALAAQVSIVGAMTYEFTVAPGGSYEGAIDVNNPGDKPQEIKAYQTDYFFYADGKFVYGEPGGLPRSNARWITITPKQVVIPPKDTVKVHFSIQVPDDSTLKGSYWSVIMVQPIDPNSPEASGPGTGQPAVGISEVMRYAIQVIAHFGDSGARSVKFTQMKLEAEEGQRRLVVDVENTGERMLRGGLWIDLYDTQGVFIGKFEGGKRRIYPLTSVRYTAELVGVENGSYKALVVVDCGGDDVFGINVNLVLKD